MVAGDKSGTIDWLQNNLETCGLVVMIGQVRSRSDNDWSSQAQVGQ